MFVCLFVHANEIMHLNFSQASEFLVFNLSLTILKLLATGILFPVKIDVAFLNLV